MVDLAESAEHILLGESMRSLAATYRNGLLTQMGFDLDDAPGDLFRKETVRYMNQLGRHLGDHHAGDRRVAAALREWVRTVEDYDAFDTLLTHYKFDNRDAVLRRGRVLFPGPLTAHWGDASGDA